LDGVDYFDWKKFPFNERHSVVILWRVYGLLCAAPFSIKASEIWLDLHDGVNIKQFMEMWFRYGSKVTRLFFKSEFHKEMFEKELRVKLKPERFAIIPNGVRIEEFSQNIENVPRNPFRFCYTSCYTRGLANILQHMWPIIFRAEPRAELHVYYGMDYVQDDKFKNAMKQLLGMPGVMDHGRQPVEIIVREKYLSSFHLYITHSNTEIDCITVRESLLTGAIPLISNSGIFKERDGIHFNIEDNPTSYAQAALKIIPLMKDPNLDSFRENLKSSKSLITWEEVAEQWLSQSSSLSKGDPGPGVIFGSSAFPKVASKETPA
jgi:glycosyltransferase involved in cell wall biosynthesis